MGALLKLVVVVILAVIVQYAFRIYNTWGGFVLNHQHYPGPCEQVEGVQPGSEDFETLSNGQTFISSGIRHTNLEPTWQDYWTRHSVKGRMYLMDLNDPASGAKELKISPTPNFNADTFTPVGISVWEDKKDGRHTVFVVNRPYAEKDLKHRVEKFEYDPVAQELLHQATFSDPSMKELNDVQATGENSFYFTNTNYFSKLWLMILEMILRLPLVDIVHFDGTTYTVVVSGVDGPNGVTMSPDGKFVYVAFSAAREIVVYKRDPINSSLTPVQTYPLYSWPDNLLIDENTGRMFVAAQPLPYKFMQYAAGQSNIAPSQVLQLGLEDGLITSSMELFYDHGELISASSTAIVYNGNLLIGSVLHSLVTCRVYVPLL